MLICGSRAIHNLDNELDICSGNTAKKSCKIRTKLCSKDVKNRKNPYATRGLDKFSSLVAELKEKRQRIYAETKNSDDIYVWFNFSGSDVCKPVILKMKDKTEKNSCNKSQHVEELCKITKPHAPQPVHKSEMKKPQFTKATAEIAEPYAPAPVQKAESKRSKSLLMSEYLNYADGIRQRPLQTLLVAVILILILLIMFERSGAVIFITVGWYMIPTSTNPRSRTKDVPAKIQVRSPERAVQGGHRG